MKVIFSDFVSYRQSKYVTKICRFEFIGLPIEKLSVLNIVLIHLWTMNVIVESTRFNYLGSECDIVIIGFLIESQAKRGKQTDKRTDTGRETCNKCHY